MAVRDVNELLPVAQTACRLFLEECEKEGLPVLITETYRSQERQDELYAQGRTKPGKKVTWTKNSRHTSRLAWDICKNVKGEEYSDTEFFKACGRIAKRLGITWGGDWSTPDMPHFEVVAGYRTFGDGPISSCTDAIMTVPICPYEEGDEEMTIEERHKFNMLVEQVEKLTERVEELQKKLPKVYHYTIDVPEWGRPTVQRMLDKGVFSGAAEDDLNLSEDMLRMMVVIERIGGR